MTVLYLAFKNYIFVVGFIASVVAICNSLKSERKETTIAGILIAVISVVAIIFQIFLTRVPNIHATPICSAIVLINEAELEYVIQDENGEVINPEAHVLVDLKEPSLANKCVDKGTVITLIISPPAFDEETVIDDETIPPFDYDEFVINDIEAGSDDVYFSTFTFEDLTDAEINDLNFTMKIRAGSHSPSNLMEMKGIEDELYFEVEDHWFNFLAPQLTIGDYTLFVSATDNNGKHYFSSKVFEVE